MKCFLKKVLLFLLPLAAALCLFEAMLRMIPNDYTYKKKRLRADAKTIEVLFFGSSHVIADINPLFVSPDTFNLAFPTQTPDVDYKLLKRYGEKMENLRCVAIAISDFSLYSRIQDIWANHRLMTRPWKKAASFGRNGIKREVKTGRLIITEKYSPTLSPGARRGILRYSFLHRLPTRPTLNI